ncbi:MAG: SDR family oxidoreductase [Anaerolineales bacterium]|nr:SDR family oxidoreductase [Anaerolineales bacterium]
MDLGLSNKSALVTGASRGLGYATALALAREGCRVAINSRDEKAITSAAEKITGETGSQVIGLAGELGDPQTPASLVEAVSRDFQGLDILITNAGGPPAGAFEQIGDEQWQQAVDLSLMSHVRLIRAALPWLRKSDAPSVLTITSISVKQPIVNLVLSNSVRAATIGLTKTLALELGGEGIRFNSILPGWTETERVTQLMTARAEANSATIEDEFKKQAAESPFGRMARPEEFARAAVFLASPAASYITGIMLSVDGGMYKGIL